MTTSESPLDSSLYHEEGAVRIFKKHTVGLIDHSLVSGLKETPKIKEENKNEIQKEVPVINNSELTFYNPAQVLNRDISLIVIKSFAIIRQRECISKLRLALESQQKKVDDIVFDSVLLNGLRISEPLAASGLRSLRYIKELPNDLLDIVIASDISPAAVEHMKNNCKLNDIDISNKKEENKKEDNSSSQSRAMFIPLLADASELLYSSKFILHPSLLINNSSRAQFDVVDLDPFGSAVEFIDAGIQALRNGGLLCVTCTDMTILGGNSSEVSFYKYGGNTVKAKYIHELSLRLVLHQLIMTAAKYRKFIEPVLSLSIDFYVRIFVRVWNKPFLCSSIQSSTAIVAQCTDCQNFVCIPFGRTSEPGDPDDVKGDKKNLKRQTALDRKNKKMERKKMRKLNNNNYNCENENNIEMNIENKNINTESDEMISGSFDETPTSSSSVLDDENESKTRDTVSLFPSPSERVKEKRCNGNLSADQICSECKTGRMKLAGPFYAGSLHSQMFLDLCLAESLLIENKIKEENGNNKNEDQLEESVDKSEDENNCLNILRDLEIRVEKTAGEPLRNISMGKVIQGILAACQEELFDVPLFYHLPSLCTQFRSEMIKTKIMKSALLNLGYRAGLFHRDPQAIKTDAPASVVFDIIRSHLQDELKKSKKNISDVDSHIVRALRTKPTTIEVDFTFNKLCLSQKDHSPKWIAREPHWGPGTKKSTK